MKTHQQVNRGFTIIELIIAALVIGLLITLALPALQAARTNARVTTCANNLKQLAIAMHNYHDTYNVFPPGWISHTPYPQEKTSFGWHASILPFIEQGPLYDSMNYVVGYGEDAFAAKKSDPSLLAITLYRCPDDVTEPFNTMRGGFATSNYSGVHGNMPLPRWAPDGIDHFWPGTTITPISSNGVFAWNSKIGIRDMTDGSSNTFMLGERSVSSAAGIWPGVRSNNTETDQVTTSHVGNEINSGLDAFSSRHSGGAQFAMCDGSVHFINEKISSYTNGNQPFNLGTFQRLGQRNDGQPVGDF